MPAMQLGEFLGDRNNPIVPLICQECGETVFVKGTMTIDNALRRSVLEVEHPDHEHEIFFERRVIGYF
jgi:hypothetical protein